MPNWCSNSITIQGPTETVKTLWDEAQANWKSGNYGLLDAMVPMPEALKGTTSPCESNEALEKAHGASNWYAWASENWGTKWDINDEGLEYEDMGDGTSVIQGWFESAWAPPVAAYDAFLDDMDGCSIDATYEECGMDYAGIYEDGKDAYMEDLSDWCRKIVKGEMTLEDTPKLFQRLDEEFDLVDSRREYIEEEIAEETEEA